VATPINVAMFCLIHSGLKSISIFEEHYFNIAQLYEEVIIWLGKRYENKKDFSKRLHTCQLTPLRILNMDELKILKLIAYNEFVANHLIVSGETIDRYAYNINPFLTVEEVYKYGIFKVDNAVCNQSLTQEYAFVHLSFQEYLSADVLKETLMSDNSVECAAAAEFVANHRNEPRYLIIFKFLTGFVTTTNKEGNQEEQKNFSK
jgi:hypothetical protein